MWARDSGRTDCSAAAAEEKPRRRKKPRPAAGSGEKEKPRSSLSNGFSCPGGKLGVHISLPHPSSCRSYYVCLNGVEPSEQGCKYGQVFNPATSACSNPEAVPGCENFYAKSTRTARPRPTPKAEAVTGAGAGLGAGDAGDIRGFLQILQASGLLKEGALETLGSLEAAPAPRQQLAEQEDSFETPRESRRKSFFERKIPPQRRNKFTSIIPKIRYSCTCGAKP